MKLLKRLFSNNKEELSPSQELIARSKNVLMPLFEPQQVVPSHGEGCYIYDIQGKRYIDFAAGIAVNALGHNHPVMRDAAREQLDKIIHIPGNYLSEPKVRCAELLTANSCFDQAFFCNSGAETIEGAIKLSRKWAYETKGPECNEIIAFENAFHGRTMGAASITNKRSSQPFYAPYIDGIHFAVYNDIQSVEELVSDKTAAIFIEPIQGEGGIIPIEPAFLKQLRALCDKKKIALVFDEIQAGMGRTGHFYAYQHHGIEPDIAALAKGLGGGFPIGALVAKKAFGNHFNAGAHGSTYSGNPLGTAISSAVLEHILSPGFLDNVREAGQYLYDGLAQIQADTDLIEDIRGLGLMIGVDFPSVKGADLIPLLQKNGMLATASGKRTLRLTPALIVTKDHIDEALEIIKTTLKEAVK